MRASGSLPKQPVLSCQVKSQDDLQAGVLAGCKCPGCRGHQTVLCMPCTPRLKPANCSAQAAELLDDSDQQGQPPAPSLVTLSALRDWALGDMVELTGADPVKAHDVVQAFQTAAGEAHGLDPAAAAAAAEPFQVRSPTSHDPAGRQLHPILTPRQHSQASMHVVCRGPYA